MRKKTVQELDWEKFTYGIAICTDKKNRQYSFDTYIYDSYSSQLTKTEFKKVVEHYFGVQLLSIQSINIDSLEIKGKRRKKIIESFRENHKGKYRQWMIILKPRVSIFIKPGEVLIIPFDKFEKDSKKKINFDDILIRKI